MNTSHAPAEVARSFPVHERRAPSQPAWLNLARVARVEASSQDARHPIEDACSPRGDGWRAAGPGEQVIRVIFPSPRSIARIRVVFHETAADRTQEFTLRWSGRRGEQHRRIVQQRFTFGRFGSTTERHEYAVELHDVTRLELRIVPDLDFGEAVASLAELRVA